MGGDRPICEWAEREIAMVPAWAGIDPGKTLSLMVMLGFPRVGGDRPRLVNTFR